MNAKFRHQCLAHTAWARPGPTLHKHTSQYNSHKYITVGKRKDKSEMAHALAPVVHTSSGKQIPVAITVAGSDSGGGAGIQADLKTFAACGVFGTTAITALTAQNTRGVSGIHEVPAEFIRQQLTAVLDDLPVTVVKTGMLPTVEVNLNFKNSQISST
jgi:hypothetical protein